jgi:hypothetical protein
VARRMLRILHRLRHFCLSFSVFSDFFDGAQ